MIRQTDAFNCPAQDSADVIFVWSATECATADADGLIDGGECSGTEAVTLTNENSMPCCRNVTATAGGTATDIKAVRVKVIGTDIDGQYQEEELPAFTEDTAGTVTGSKCFKTVESVVVPAMDGNGVTIDVGWGNVYGLPYKLTENPLYLASVNGTNKTATFGISSGGYTTVTFQTNPSNNVAKLIIFLV